MKIGFDKFHPKNDTERIHVNLQPSELRESGVRGGSGIIRRIGVGRRETQKR